ncbi:MAG: hypothetical protein IPN13_00165 [Bacteroidetes bacterium]|nr:hypothetical protein [Bacteroidota bacterium]
MKNILSKYETEYNSIREGSEYNFGLAQSFVAKLLALPAKELYELLPLFKQIENDVWEHGVMLPNLSYEELEKEKKVWEASSKKKTKKIFTKPNVEDDFNKVLFHFFSKYDLALNRVKGYFLFQARNTDNTQTKVRILYDDEFNKHPEINSFDIEEHEYDLKKFSLKEFSELVVKENEIQNQNYLFVFLITPHIRHNQELIDVIKGLINLFSSNYIAIKKKPIESSIDFDFRRTEDGFRAIEFFSGKIFNNREISFEEESILKMLFPGSEMILDYKILKKGNSGSKVIEIQPLRVDSPIMSRFVAKYSAIDSERKIHDERDRFNQWVRNYGVNGYSADYYYNDTHEAIMYNYASSDSKTDSSPFSKLIGDAVKGDYNYTYSLEKVIEELFDCSPFLVWKGIRHIEITATVKTIYGDYLKSEAKILRAISLIKGVNESEINSDELVRNYRIIKDFQLKTFKKICHGDLHSENFFKDEQGVYLIDFGWTNQHHSLIDHATLECSLKFKHLPFYIPLDELTNCEAELLSINSFSKSFDLSFIRRPSVLEIAKLITQIRENAKQHMIDNSNPLEYLISLFIINFRQIQYPDLNQAYALATAEVLSNKIIELIKE